MHSILHWFAARAGILAAAMAVVAVGNDGTPVDAADFDPIFDGETLDGWDGNPKFWRVEDGAITGETTADNPTESNTFIIWREGEVGDFELKLEYRISGHNSGIQYRSFEVPDQKWVVGGYQADMEAGDMYSGILYGERFRGILALRGKETVIGDDHKPKVVGSVGDSDEIQSKINKDGWNEYHIIAKGFRFTHKINGVTTCICTDNDEEMRRARGIVALQLHAGPPMKVQFRNIRLKRSDSSKEQADASDADSTKKVVFIAGKKSHGYGAHEHRAGCMLLADALNKHMPSIRASVVTDGWPEDASVLDDADAIVLYADGGGGHPLNAHLDEMDRLMDKGIGLVCLHYAVEIPKGEPGDRLLDWTGGYFETNWSVNPHWTAEYYRLPKHPITKGVKPFVINDEWYYHMRFRDEMEGVEPILTAVPPTSTLDRPDGPHSNNEHVRAKIGLPQHMAWATERDDGGRGFGFTGGHFHWNWGHDGFRTLVLNAVVWAAKAEVPKGGVPSDPVTLEDLKANQDYPQPDDFNGERIAKLLEQWNRQTAQR